LITMAHRTYGLPVLMAQGLYFGLTGLWPIVSINTFMAVTGFKTDIWLVKTVAVLLIAIAVSLCIAAVGRRLSAETVALAISSSVALIGIDVVYVANGTIRPIYLADAAAEAVLILWVLNTWRRSPAPRYMTWKTSQSLQKPN